MSRKNIKKISALAMAAAIMSQLTACGENTTWGAEIDGSQIPAGIFIYYLQNAYYDAQSKLNEEGTLTEDTDILTAQIEGKSGSDWILDEATRAMQEYAAIESQFDKYELALSAEIRDSAKLYCDQLWNYGGEYYTQIGISQKSYQSIFLNAEKRELLFDSLYSEGGEYGVSDDEIRSYLDENYVMINYIDMELKDGEGNLLKSEGKEERRAMAEEYISRYKSGEDFDELNAEYVTYYQRLQDEAAEAAALEAAEAAETEETEEGAVTEEVEDSEANAALTSDEDELEDDGETDEDAEDTDTEESEEEAESEDDTSDEEENEDDDAQTDEDEDSEADTDEEAGTDEEGEDADDEDETAETAEENENDDADESGSIVFDPDDVQVNTVSSNQTVLDRESTYPSAEVTEASFEMNKGDIQIVESADGEHYYVVLKLDIIETDEYFDTAKESLLHEMRSEDFDSLIDSWIDLQHFSKNLDAYERYAPEKMFTEEN